TSLLTSTSAMPPSTIASASDTFWQQTPIAPAAIWRLPISGHLCVFAWARTRTPLPATAFCRTCRLRSNASRSRTSAGVSTSSRRWPTRAGGAVTRAGAPASGRSRLRGGLGAALAQREGGDRHGDDRDERQGEQVHALPAGGGDG